MPKKRGSGHCPICSKPAFQFGGRLSGPLPLFHLLATQGASEAAREGRPMAQGEISGEYDVVVVGGGNAGMGAALAERGRAEACQRAPTRCTSSE